ncbi:hypothetical protein [Pseudodesulfovibrio sediminis]|uniref:Uncharacterized protein n=1 Tax=Pseudodesulfovibrio sediminis TaxID=2810563 RepID=A0ABN6EYD4_9BACT|nr:hypothetical protein [Pseudodesulfovibrio sediminis]BCS90056.1 hypothetical protein PSDVSF_32980 [Pseudodesulfovibrio sediminis]
MQGKNVCQLSISGTIVFTMLLVAGLAMAGPPKEERLISGVSQPVGLVRDTWANLYYADMDTGQIFCLPHDGEPTLYATIEGAPTALAIDTVQTLYIGTETGTIFAVLQNGSMVEAYHCHGSVAELNLDRDGGLVVFLRNGTILRVNREQLILHQ